MIGIYLIYLNVFEESHYCKFTRCVIDPSRKWYGGTLVLWRSRVSHFSGLIHNTSWPSTPTHTHIHTHTVVECSTVWRLQPRSSSSSAVTEQSHWQDTSQCHFYFIVHLQTQRSHKYKRSLACFYYLDIAHWSRFLALKVVAGEYSPLLCSAPTSSAPTVHLTAVIVKVLNNKKQWRKRFNWGSGSKGAVPDFWPLEGSMHTAAFFSAHTLVSLLIWCQAGHTPTFNLQQIRQKQENEFTTG